MSIRSVNILYFLGIVLAVACSQTEVEQDPICFAPVASKSTKAIISGTTYPTGESFVVSAYYNGTDDYFNDLEASYSSAAAFWETSSSQYWPLRGSLTFNAFSPASASSSGITIDANGVSVTDYTIQTAQQMATDFCYASATVADCTIHPDAVPLTFAHALSQVVFRVKADAYYSTASRTVRIMLTSLDMQGIYSVGDFSYGTWENQSAENYYTLSNTSTELTYDGSNRPETIDVCSYLFLPQELGPNAAITVGYDLVQTVSGNVYTLSNSPVTIPLGAPLTEWQPGKKYIYTLNIGMNNLITFSVSTVGWQDESENIIVEEN
ncbi:MAG: fimbrillin family protein [Bacteroidales bacterium]|nr:fimbrillin family protein [Bacteroidales bacterium]